MTRLSSRILTVGTWVSRSSHPEENRVSIRVNQNVGANIPGKIREQLNWPGGFPLYYEETRKVLDNGFEGFKTQPPAAAT